MQELIKLIWDFKGPNASPTAVHHEIHLKEFCEKEKHKSATTGVTHLSEFHSIAFVVVPKDLMPVFRDALRPHRGTLVTTQT